MFKINLETHLKLYFSNICLVIITTSILMSNNTGKLPLRKGFQNLHLAFYPKQMDTESELNLELFGSIFLTELEPELFSSIFFAELELELLGSIFSPQSRSWSLKALGVKWEPAQNWSRLSISAFCSSLTLASLLASLLA